MRRRFLNLGLVMLAIASCGGKSSAAIGKELKGKSPTEVEARFGKPAATNPHDMLGEDGPIPGENWYYDRSKILGGDSDGNYTVIEFSQDKVESAYDIDAAKFKKDAGGAGGGDD
jgi:hypothetical protein